MAILITYNGYTHPQGEVEVRVARQALFTEAETAYAERAQVQLTGTLVGNGTIALDALYRALVAAYSTDGGDFVMTGPLGKALEPSIYSANTIGGVRVVRRPSMTDGRNAAYLNFINYQIVLEAVVPASNPITLLRSFREQIRFRGGGKVYGTLETRTGTGHRQIWTQQSIYRAEQSGQAVGLYSSPTIPRPIWPKWLVETPDVLRDGGHFTGDVAVQNWIQGGKRRSATIAGAMDFTVRWRYLFESTEELIGAPNTWG